MATMTKDGARELKPHNHCDETFVCRDCGTMIDPVGGNYPGYTQQQADDAECPHCGGTDTKWSFADE